MDTNTNNSTEVAVVILSTGSHHKITQETFNQIVIAGLDDLITTHKGVTFKTSAIMEILGIDEYLNQYPDKQSYSYGQPYTDTKALPSGNVYSRSKKNAKELMLKGFRKIKPEATMQDLNKVTIAKPIKYNTWEEYKAADMLPV